MATSVKECSICQDEIKDSRLLPCVHSFCLQCLEEYCSSMNKLPGDEVPCPECRYKFQIPKNGVAGLTVRTHDQEREPSAMCEVCSYEQRSIPATLYCFDCCQKLCERCSRPHLRWRGGPHDVKPLDKVIPEHRSKSHYCDRHKERAKIYCFDCKISVCSMCCYELHKKHKSEQIEIVVREFAKSIDDDIKPVTSRIENFRAAATQLEAETSKLLGSSGVGEQQIKKRGKKVKQSAISSIARQVNDLLQTLQSMKSAAEKEVQSRTDAVQLALTELESLRTSSLELKSKGSPSDIVQAASDVRVRASELLQKHVIPAEYLAPSFQFAPADTDQLLRDDHNFIGHVSKVPGTANSYCFLII